MTQIYEPAEDSYLLSEVLEHKLPSLLKKSPNLKFLEVGVGSGVQLMTASNCGIKKENISGVDINSDAVNHCKDLGFNCKLSNLFDNVKETYDIIIFNAPYLPKSELEDEESELITTGGKQGGEVVNDFLSQSKKHLKSDAKIYLLISNLTKGIDWKGFKKKLVSKKKIFFEELICYEITV